MDTERRSQVANTVGFICGMEEENKTNSDLLTDIVNITCPANTTSGIKDNRGENVELAPVSRSQNQPQFVFPVLSNAANSAKFETDSKELSKTVAESMGLYMNEAREPDYALSPQAGPGLVIDAHGKSVFPSGGQHLVSSLSSAGCAKPKPAGLLVSAPYPAMSCSCPSIDTKMACVSDVIPVVEDRVAPTLDCSAHNGSSGFTSSPTSFGKTFPQTGSPLSQVSALSGLAHIPHHGIPTTCSPSNSSTVGSPLASPLNIMKTPMSSPRSMGSVKSPPSCNPIARSSVSSPTGSCGKNPNMREAISSPGNINSMSVSSPPNLTGFPLSSPAGGLGIVQNDSHSPIQADQGFGSFEFPKLERVDTHLCSVGLDELGMVKYIKNEPDCMRTMCANGDRSHIPSSPFAVQIKSEPIKDSTCLNSPFNGEQHSLSVLPAGDTTYLSLRDSVDENSLCGILGPPVSLLNGNCQPDAFSSNILPNGIKQESKDGSYYQQNGNMPPSAIVGVNSCGHSFHYQIGAQGTMSFSRHDARDQANPVLNLISPVTALMENWKPHPCLPQNALTPRGEGYPGQRCIADNMASSNRNSSSSSSSAKVCLVCGDEASGCHYGVVTCGSCKVFFKRAIEGQHNYLCAGRNDCIIDKIRRKNCPACRVRKCLQAGMNLGARKSKKLGKLKVIGEEASLHMSKEGQTYLMPEKELSNSAALVTHSGMTPYLSPSICSVLELIEPEVVYAGYDNSQPDTTDHLLSSLNQLGGKQMIRLVKWAKLLPGFRSLPIEDQITLIQYSWMCLSSFALSWRSYKHTNGQMLYFAPDLVFNEERMQQSAMYELCVGMRQVSREFVRLQLTDEEFLSMKVLLLLSTVPKEGLKNQVAFEEMRVNYIKELRRSVGKATSHSGQTWPRFYQLTKLLDAMHDLVGDLLDFCFYTFRESQALKVEFPEMLVEIISDQLPKVESGLTQTLYFHKK
ncbi:hypothetical protein GJAV_G00163060 [Gymnothorax javanicus]|nr:hypothetical protein GJAV_G00163060 [Gymnothorax javanicus]